MSQSVYCEECVFNHICEDSKDPNITGCVVVGVTDCAIDKDKLAELTGWEGFNNETK